MIDVSFNIFLETTFIISHAFAALKITYIKKFLSQNVVIKNKHTLQ